MAFVNCGAFVGGRRPKSKKELRDMAASNPERVSFDVTSVFGRQDAEQALDLGDKLQIAGPDPYTSRKWYATVTRKADGTLVVK